MCNPNKARDERRLQLIQLTQEVEELQFTLVQLETIRNKRPKPIGDKSHIPHQDGVPLVWQEICSRQLGRRLEVERENYRLKKQYDKEKQLILPFMKLLFPRQTQNSFPEYRDTRRTEVPTGYVERMTALIFKELEAGVKLCYSMVDRFFETKRHVPTPESSAAHCGLLHGGKGTERKFLNRRTVPFDMQATGGAWWENWQTFRGQGLLDADADEISERYGLEMIDFKTHTTATAFGQQITQRHIENGRIVFVFHAYVEPFGFNTDHVDGIYFLEQAYVLVQPEKNISTGENDCFSTGISCCYIVTPHFLDPKLKETGKTAALIDFFASTMSSKMMTFSEMVENLLLDQTIQQPIAIGTT
ncbi:hypothetical protein PHMEG_0007488 [Phytophthora megakarya]|uniref:M96 mating-specific protein n=1 Tax=Phytophthora megakarya TaxID=4795 RepID=A0A225WND8_9STRA|nr:hypothetical protein PHMEG_0007488 [Phytophthora megakarya]